MVFGLFICFRVGFTFLHILIETPPFCGWNFNAGFAAMFD